MLVDADEPKESWIGVHEETIILPKEYVSVAPRWTPQAAPSG